MRLRAHKYGAKRTEVDGISFASKREAERYKDLQTLERAKAISGVAIQPSFELVAGIHYRADFSYYEKGKHIVEDVKGMETPVFKLKWKIAKHLYPDIEWRIVK